jgi:hypothetical protein
MPVNRQTDVAITLWGSISFIILIARYIRFFVHPGIRDGMWIYVTDH